MTDPKGFISGCANCGREIHYTVDESRGERWVHLMEPTGHDTLPNDIVRLGRARVIEELRRQSVHAREHGEELTWEWLDGWLKYLGDASVLTTAEEDGAAYRAALAALTRHRRSSDGRP